MMDWIVFIVYEILKDNFQIITKTQLIPFFQFNPPKMAFSSVILDHIVVI